MKTDNPNAFPTRSQHEDPSRPDISGMTLRDYFAAKALGVVPFVARDIYENPNTWDEKNIANEVYRIADAMLEERKNQNQ